jgi:hypothetical protein
MSPGIHVRRIGHADGPDGPSNSNFAEKPFHLKEYMPDSMDFYMWTPKLSGKYVCCPWFYIWRPKLEIMLAIHNFPKKDFEPCNNPLKNLIVYEFLRMSP